MAVSEAEKNNEKKEQRHLFLEFPWFFEHFYGRIKDCIEEYFQREYSLRFMGVSLDDENVLFFGDEYFVNKIPVNKTASFIIRMSSNLISSLLDNSLGASDKSFSIDDLTDIEASLVKDFTLSVYSKLEELFIKTEPNKKILKSAKAYNFTFYVQFKENHTGKIIISIPDYIINDNIEIEFREDCFDVSSFQKISALVTLRLGSARISLNDVKNIENGDVIVLEDSNVNKMALLWEGNLVDFNIIPNPSLIISVDKTGGDEMSNNQAISDNMWDTILVDVVAEFDNFKLTLGELKQISEGLVIDVGSVYNNKVKLRVAKQVVASGELVILNDRYGVRIDSVKNNTEGDVEYEEIEENEQPVNSPVPNENAPEQNVPDGKQGDENFNYSDFEIEDESI